MYDAYTDGQELTIYNDTHPVYGITCSIWGNTHPLFSSTSGSTHPDIKFALLNGATVKNITPQSAATFSLR
jgi:hypothetical protein